MNAEKKPLVVDARGLACPGPVMKARKALQGIAAGEELVVLVDDEACSSNVSIMAENQGHRVSVEAAPRELRVTIKKK